MATTAITHADAHHVTRERHFPADQFERVLLMVHEERLTGQLIIDINQGGVASIRLHERKKLPLGEKRS